MAKEKKNKVMQDEQPTPRIENTVDFEVWFTMRKAKIPAQHLREIIRADFTARGLQQCETVQVFDLALRQYGVLLS